MRMSRAELDELMVEYRHLEFAGWPTYVEDRVLCMARAFSFLEKRDEIIARRKK